MLRSCAKKWLLLERWPYLTSPIVFGGFCGGECSCYAQPWTDHWMLE